MRKTIITCDFCGENIKNSSADIDFMIIENSGNRIKTGDICESCKDKISEFLENLKKEKLLDTEFTKKEAIELMKEGYKMTHFCFEPREWCTIISDGLILFEDGYKVTLKQFWLDRANPVWEKGWKHF